MARGDDLGHVKSGSKENVQPVTAPAAAAAVVAVQTMPGTYNREIDGPRPSEDSTRDVLGAKSSVALDVV